MTIHKPQKPPKWVMRRIIKRLKCETKSGIVIWANPDPQSRVKPGTIAGSLNKSGYLQITFRDKDLGSRTIQIHHLVWFFSKGKWPTKEIDHKDNIKTDNRIRNLRLATPNQNKHNYGKYKSNTSGYKGVFSTNNKWRACIRTNNKLIHLGCFNTVKAAARAYDRAAIKHHGKFAKLNFPL